VFYYLIFKLQLQGLRGIQRAKFVIKQLYKRGTKGLCKMLLKSHQLDAVDCDQVHEFERVLCDAGLPADVESIPEDDDGNNEIRDDCPVPRVADQTTYSFRLSNASYDDFVPDSSQFRGSYTNDDIGAGPSQPTQFGYSETYGDIGAGPSQATQFGLSQIPEDYPTYQTPGSNYDTPQLPQADFGTLLDGIFSPLPNQGYTCDLNPVPSIVYETQSPYLPVQNQSPFRPVESHSPVETQPHSELVPYGFSDGEEESVHVATPVGRGCRRKMKAKIFTPTQ